MKNTGATASAVLFYVSLLLTISGCGSMSIGHEYDPTFDFSTLKTYAWISIPDESPEVELIMKRLRPMIDDRLAKSGFKQSDDPDFKVATHVQSKDAVDVVNWGYGYGWRGSYGYGFEAYQYEEGSLLVDIVDAKTNELVWQGLARAELKHTDPELRDRTARRAINKLFKHFPPKDK
ncbi:DUF4136 domain-containing protein [Kaarinaea lacus]